MADERQVLIPQKNTYDNPTDALQVLVNDGFDNLDRPSSSSCCSTIFSKETWFNFATVVIAALVGTLAAYYYIPSAFEAAEFLIEALLIPAFIGNCLKILFPTSGALLNLFFGAQCLIEMADLLKRSHPAATYLARNPKPTTLLENIAWYLKHSVAFIFTLGSVTPAFAMTIGGDVTLAFGTTIANFPVNYIGVYGLFKPGFSIEKRLLLQYINEQIQFLNNWYNLKPTRVMNVIGKIKRDAKKFTGNQKLSFLLYTILNLATELRESYATEALESGVSNSTVVVKSQGQSLFRKLSSMTITAISVGTMLGYVWQAYTMGSLLKDEPKGVQVAAGISSAILTFIPFFGLGYRAGKKVGDNIFSGNSSLADGVLPNLTALLRGALGVFACFSGGTNLQVNHDFINQFPLIHLIFRTRGTEILDVAYSAGGGIGAPIANFYFSDLLIQEILTFHAKYLGKEIQEFINFNAFLKSITTIIEDMDQQNYESFLKNAMTHDSSRLSSSLSSAPDVYMSKLSDQLHAIFNSRLSEKTKADLFNKLGISSRNVTTINLEGKDIDPSNSTSLSSVNASSSSLASYAGL